MTDSYFSTISVIAYLPPSFPCGVTFHNIYHKQLPCVYRIEALLSLPSVKKTQGKLPLN